MAKIMRDQWHMAVERGVGIFSDYADSEILANETITNVEDEMNPAAADLKVKVNVKQLLDLVKENKEKHAEEYREALEGWLEELRTQAKEAATEALEMTLDEAQEMTALERNMLGRFTLTPPRNYLEEYDQVIGTLSMAEDEELELTGRQVNAWAHDRWDWKEDFATSNVFYMKHKRRRG